MDGKWGYSTDEENYAGIFDTPEQAECAARIECEEEDRSMFWVGQFRAPRIEQAIHGDVLIDRILSTDDFSNEWGEDAFNCTREQVNDLTERLQKAFIAWMEANGTRPRFGLIKPETIREYTALDIE